MKSNMLRRMAVGMGVYSVIMGLIVGVLMLMRPPPPKNPLAARRLVQAILHNDTEEFKAALKDGANPNAVDILGQTPLFMAALPPETPQQVEIAKLLLQFHADPTVKDKSGMTVLAHAQKDQRTGIVKLLQISP